MEYFFIKEKENYFKILLNDIIYIKSLEDYCEIHLADKRYIVHFTLKSFEEMLDQRFYRCHRQYIVNTDKINRIENINIYCGNKNIIISKASKSDLLL